MQDWLPQSIGQSWAERIHAAISEHLLEQVGASAIDAPSLVNAPGGHDWDED